MKLVETLKHLFLFDCYGAARGYRGLSGAIRGNLGQLGAIQGNQGLSGADQGQEKVLSTAGVIIVTLAYPVTEFFTKT